MLGTYHLGGKRQTISYIDQKLRKCEEPSAMKKVD